jgi:hypothetical protein
MRRLYECGCGCGGMDGGCMQEPDNYMFFGNLKTIKRHIDAMLEMDPQMVDSILSDGHGWAVDHIASSLDDIQEVANFLMSTQHQGGENPLAGLMMQDNPFSKLAKSFESFTVNEAKKKEKMKAVAKKKKQEDQDGDGDNDYADAKLAQYKAGGMDKKRAMMLAKKYNLK